MLQAENLSLLTLHLAFVIEVHRSKEQKWSLHSVCNAEDQGWVKEAVLHVTVMMDSAVQQPQTSKGRWTIIHIHHVYAACKWHQCKIWTLLQYHKMHFTRCSCSKQFEHALLGKSDLISLYLYFDYCLPKWCRITFRIIEHQTMQDGDGCQGAKPKTYYATCRLQQSMTASQWCVWYEHIWIRRSCCKALSPPQMGVQQ